MKQLWIHITQLKMQPDHDREQLLEKACKKLRIQTADIETFEIAKQSIDARKGQIQYNYTVDLKLKHPGKLRMTDKDISLIEKKSYVLPACGDRMLPVRPVIAGSGPAGLFCAYLLAQRGFCPIVYERGASIEQRKKDVEEFWKTGVLNLSSNVQFGEGGAGTFSDGKLTTAVKDKSGRIRYVLETFVKFGAPEDILYVNKPHIGTDVLMNVVANMRNAIIQMGGSVSFDSCVTEFHLEDGAITEITVNGKHRQPVQVVVLATGHSARDTFETLRDQGISMEAKPFAVGFRVEHPQEMIQMAQYKTTDRKFLPAADYKVTYHASNGRSVYSFCMCPGGYVVNASSEACKTAVNGMSYRARDSKNANSAIIVSVTPEDFSGDDPLSGMAFQRQLEEKAFALGQGAIPMQRFGDFEADRPSEGPGSITGCEKGAAVFTNLRGILPEACEQAFCEGMHGFAKKIRGFDRPDTLLCAVESRTSSPVRIHRDETMQSNVRGLYPCGEGAGYAGGITSAAVDGMKVAEAILREFKPF